MLRGSPPGLLGSHLCLKAQVSGFLLEHKVMSHRVVLIGGGWDVRRDVGTVTELCVEPVTKQWCGGQTHAGLPLAPLFLQVTETPG